MIDISCHGRKDRTRLTGLLIFFMKGVNIEIKAKTTDLAIARQILLAAGAVLKGIDRQTDTYFKVSHGRLKLRQGNVENNLIHYFREDKSGPKKSEVIVCPVASESEEIKNALATACGILAEVNKTREIYYIGNAKFHLDEVKNLGKFIEIEIFGYNNQEELWQDCRKYMQALGIHEGSLISNSYSDMLISLNSDKTIKNE